MQKGHLFLPLCKPFNSALKSGPRFHHKVSLLCYAWDLANILFWFLSFSMIHIAVLEATTLICIMVGVQYRLSVWGVLSHYTTYHCAQGPKTFHFSFLWSPNCLAATRMLYNIVCFFLFGYRPCFVSGICHGSHVEYNKLWDSFPWWINLLVLTILLCFNASTVIIGILIRGNLHK